MKVRPDQLDLLFNAIKRMIVPDTWTTNWANVQSWAGLEFMTFSGAGIFTMCHLAA